MLADYSDRKIIPPGPDQKIDLHTSEESFGKVAELILQFGNITRFPSSSRRSDSYLINHPAYIKHVLVKNSANYTKGVGFERVKLLLGNGIIVSDGLFWRRQRRMIQPAFSRQTILELMSEMVNCNNELLSEWRQLANTGKVINLTETASELSLQVVLRAIFGEDLQRIEARAGYNPFSILTENSVRDMQLVLKYRELKKLVQQVIDYRRDSGSRRNDFLGSIMQAIDKETGKSMDDKEIIDEVMTLIVAGHETSACTLNWVWYLLSQDSEVEQQVQHEADQFSMENLSMESFIGLAYSRQVIEEALRLYPPVWLFSRKAIGEDMLGDYYVPAGTDIFIAPYFLHRHLEYWDEPDKFMPARFNAEAVKTRDKNVYIPFSAGQRRCIGDFFAIVEMQLHLAMMAREFRLIYVQDKPLELAPEVNLRTKHNILMKIVSR